MSLKSLLRDQKNNSKGGSVHKMSEDELEETIGGNLKDPNETSMWASGSGCGSNTCVCLDCLD